MSKKVAFGRPGNNLKVGIVGMPNVGKSSLFNLLQANMEKEVPAENYPFCTIDPHNAVVPVSDERFRFLCEKCEPKSEVGPVLTVTDIAGLVKGACEGKGLGSKFLSNIQAVDAIYHQVRAFKKKSIEHVEGSVDPARDVEIIRSELVAKDKARMATMLEDLKKKGRASKDKKKKEELATAEKAVQCLNDGMEIRRYKDWNNKDIMFLNTIQLLTAKPVIYLVNMSREFYEKKKAFKGAKKLMAWLKKNDPGAKVITYSVEFEAAVAAKKRGESVDVDDTRPSLLQKIINAGYDVLGLQRFYTVGKDEVKAWTIKKGTTAKKAAGHIHGEIGDTFIKADVFNYVDFKEFGSEAAVASAGKKRIRGADYEMVDGDIVFFHSRKGHGK